MASRWLAFLIWGLVALTATSWLLRLTAGGMPVPLHAQSVDAGSALRGDLARVLGKTAAAPSATESGAPSTDGRLRLIGVIAPKLAADQTEALALIAVGTKQPQAFRVGAVVDGDLRVLSVRGRVVELGRRETGVQQKLELAPLPPAASGSMPASSNPSAAGAPPAPPMAAIPGMAVPPGTAPVAGMPAVMPNSVPAAGAADAVTGAPPALTPPGINPVAPAQPPGTNPP